MIMLKKFRRIELGRRDKQTQLREQNNALLQTIRILEDKKRSSSFKNADSNPVSIKETSARLFKIRTDLISPEEQPEMVS